MTVMRLKLEPTAGMPTPVMPIMTHPRTSGRYSLLARSVDRSITTGHLLIGAPPPYTLITEGYTRGYARHAPGSLASGASTSETPIVALTIARLNSLGILSVSL